jgi:D-inositol-3-phosphate glycosyltransferase
MDEFTDRMFLHLVQQGSYDLIHANFFMSGLVASRLKVLLGIPYVVTFHAFGRVRLKHQGSADRFPPVRLAIESQVMAEADAIIAECPQDQADQIALYDADPTRIRVVPRGFDGEELWPIDRRRARRRLQLDPFERLVVHVGRMVPRKGIDNAIRGFARLIHEHRISARMLMVGGESADPDPATTPEIGRLMDIAREERVAGCVNCWNRSE